MDMDLKKIQSSVDNFIKHVHELAGYEKRPEVALQQAMKAWREAHPLSEKIASHKQISYIKSLYKQQEKKEVSWTTEEFILDDGWEEKMTSELAYHTIIALKDSLGQKVAHPPDKLLLCEVGNFYRA